MTINEHLTAFMGKPVVEWRPGEPLADPANQAYRITLSFDDDDEGKVWLDLFNEFLQQPNITEVTRLIIGLWNSADDAYELTADLVYQALIAAREQLPNLVGLFVGDITFEECEISWIKQGDFGPVLAAYPNLRHLVARGGEELRCTHRQHDQLETLIVQAGGLPQVVLADLLAVTLPNLQHLELWLGTEQYGGDIAVSDLDPLLFGNHFPQLRYLGLRDYELVDQLAPVVAQAPILQQLQVLDLSLGNLSDDGAQALLHNAGIRNLKKLDLHHHFCSDEMMARLAALPIAVDLSEQEQPDEYDGELHRYIAVSE